MKRETLKDKTVKGFAWSSIDKITSFYIKQQQNNSNSYYGF